jgi:hypothetical protein
MMGTGIALASTVPGVSGEHVTTWARLIADPGPVDEPATAVAR